MKFEPYNNKKKKNTDSIQDFKQKAALTPSNKNYFPSHRTSSDKQIRHEACSLRDHAHALIDVEMDSDFELECQEIAKRRQEEGNMADNDLPDFIYTASNLRKLCPPEFCLMRQPTPLCQLL